MKKERRMAESHAPLLQMDQFVVYLRDHLLIDKNVGIDIIKPIPAISSRQTTLLSARFRVGCESWKGLGVEILRSGFTDCDS